MTGDGVRRARARAQLLDRGGGDPPSVVQTVVGIQAQDRRAAALSIRARCAGIVVDDVRRAVAVDRSIVLTWSLRGTRHYHHRDDVRWLLDVLGPVFSQPGRRAEQLGIAGEVGDRAVRVVHDAVAADGPLTRARLAERLGRHGVDPTGQAPIHVIRRAALEGLVCVVPGGSGEERYALLDEWAPADPSARSARTPAGSRAELARRYLAAFGPATASDFAAWSGLGTRVARQTWSAIESETTGVETEAATLSVLTGHPPLDVDRPVPLRLVGGFDTLLLGYADKALHLAAQHARRVNAGGGMIRPAVVADGRVIGAWAYRRSGGEPRVEVSPFRRLSEDERCNVEREAADVGRFFGTDPTLTVMDG